MNEKNRIGIRWKIFLFVLAGIVLLVLLSFILHAMGHLQEKMIGFCMDGFYRILICITIIFILKRFYKRIHKKSSAILWLFSAIACCILLFFLIKAFVLDIPYLFHPASVRLECVNFEIDDMYQYSSFYKIEGEDKNNHLYIFNVNKSTLEYGEEKTKENHNVKADIKYLPHTDTVMEIKYLE